MLLAAHSIAGATAGSAVGTPVLAFLAGIVIHFLLDAIPHYDTTDEGKYTFRQIAFIAIDGLAGLSVIGIFFTPYWSAGMAAGMLGGILPDLIFNIPKLNTCLSRCRLISKLNAFHGLIQSISLPPFLGIAVQILVIAACIYLLKNYVV